MHLLVMPAHQLTFFPIQLCAVNEAGFGPRASLVRGAHRQPGIGTGAAAAAVMNSSAAVNMRMQQTSTLTSNQQRQMLQQVGPWSLVFRLMKGS